MSKSDGDFVRLQTLVDRGIDPLAYRYLCLGAHYRSSLRFNEAAIAGAQSALDRLRRAYAGWPEGGMADASFVARFRAEVEQDLNLPRGLAVLWELVRSDLPAATRRATVDVFEAVLGLRLAEWREEGDAVPEAIAALARERLEARAAGDWGPGRPAARGPARAGLAGRGRRGRAPAQPWTRVTAGRRPRTDNRFP